MLEFEVDVNPEFIGDLAARIMAACPGLEVDTSENSVTFSMPLDDYLDDHLKSFEQSLQALEKVKNLSELNIRSRNIYGPDTGRPIVNQGRFLVCHPGVEANPGPEQIVLTINPDAVFGTGGHTSTALALKAMEAYFTPRPGAPSHQGVRVLDAGTGSGILALAAAHLGAGPIVAVDSSAEAVAAAEANASLSELTSTIEIVQTTLDKTEGQYGLILANLVVSVLLRSGKKLVKRLSPDGTMIASGFTDSQMPQVVKALTKAGLVAEKTYSSQGWAALTLVRF